ncbi:hypothetical protein B0H13DRAFT_1852362 [Mycena leptocephala]|nr:hypothetical protein B0H13DRAFT_1852362 [Mycena leptocephala]
MIPGSNGDTGLVPQRQPSQNTKVKRITLFATPQASAVAPLLGISALGTAHSVAGPAFLFDRPRRASPVEAAPPPPERKVYRGSGSRFTLRFTPSPSEAAVMPSYRLPDPGIVNPELRLSVTASDIRKITQISTTSQYQSYEALLVDSWVRVRRFLEAQPQGSFLVNPARFDFSGEFSVVAPDLDNAVSLKDAFERVSGLKFGPTSWASTLGDIGAIAIRFACIYLHPNPAPAQIMQGELEIALFGIPS